ncbi:Ig-like domain repeat protein [Edaphobacter bradus]|uniref:Ig-like domain repeat protein n=1 Tax=Edaphobacter bradus TaxID=2259016 RepID=UPI0021E054E2|nr:Ig-like domain repeat protein [Edaphobacter bradus]
MTSPMSRSLRTRALTYVGNYLRRLAPLSLLTAAALAHAAAAPTTTSLTISATSVPYQTPIILTAKVTSGGSPVSSGLVMFCAVTTTNCETNSSLASVQLTSPNATAVVKIGSGPLGVHTYKAVYRANNSYASSTSNTVSYTVQGTYSSSSAIASSGTVGNYTLSSTVTGVGSLTTGPTGTISFLDTSAGNNVLGTQTLGPAVLTDNFTTASGSPFAISGNGNTTNRSVVIASAYLNGDNNLDLVTGDANQIITVLLGNGDGTFQPKVNYPGCSAGKALKMLLADFNRDGNTDIALGCSTGSTGGLVILLGNGDGSFQAPVEYTSGDVEGLAMGDFNGDGLLDVVVTDQTAKNVTVFLGKGDGTFQAGNVVATTSKNANDIVVGDFNQDGKDDIAFATATAAAGSNLSDLYVALGNGDGTFQGATKVASQIGEFLTSGDLNADGIPDVVSTTITGSTHIGPWMFVLLGNGTGSFQAPVKYTSDIPSDPSLTDVNGDGKPDIIAGGSYGALVYLGNGDGTFQAYNEPVIGGFSLTYAVSAGDFNNDGNADLSGTDASSPRAAVSLSEVSQNGNSGALAGVAVFPLGSGIHNVDASYSGDSIYLPSVSSTVALMAAPTPTTLALGVSPVTATLSGQAVTLTATLSPYTVGPPTTTTNGESVNFYSGSTLIGTGTLNNGVATLVTTNLPVGSDSLKAIYPGDTNYNPSTSSVISVTVAAVLLTSNPNPSTYSQAVTLTSTTPSGATGSVTFMDGAITLGVATISGTAATISTTTLTAGSHNLTAVYSGDGSHSAGTSPVVVQVVTQATPTISVVAAPNPSPYGNTVTISATLTQGATGTVTFTSGGVTLGSATVKGSGLASITTTVLPAGTDTITASYGSDNNYTPASATTQETITKASPSSTLTVSPNPAVPGASVTLTDTLPSNVTGTVTFTNGTTVLGTGTVNNGVATVSTTVLPLGTDTVTATYNGDSNNNTSVATATETIAKLNPTVTVSSTPNPSTYGQSVTITASVPAGDKGTITITSGGVTLGSGTVSAGGTVVVTTTALPVGTDTITASYGGDTTNNAATGTTSQTVSKATPTITLTSSLNPSAVNQSVTFTATLPTAATGTVTFTSGGTTLGTATVTNGTASVSSSALPVGTDTVTATYNGDGNYSTASTTLNQTVNKAATTVTVSSTPNPSTYGSSVTITASVPSGDTGTITITSGGVTLGSGTVNAGGTVVVTTTALPVGTDTITASYGGDSNNNAATGTTSETVGKTTPAITLTSTLNPSAVNQSVTFTATLPTAVTGTVTFTSGGSTLGTATVTNGTASVSTTVLPVGTDTITASYGGDGNYNTASTTLNQTVNKATTTVTVSSTPNPSTFGSSVTITASVPAGDTGTITVTSGGVTLGSGTVSAGGTVVVTTTALPVGTDTITASYGGDATHSAATGTTSQTVGTTTPTITLTSSLNPSALNQSVTFTATLPTAATGTVTFTSGGTTLGTATVTNGTASVATTVLPIGTDTITASYGGDGNYNAASTTLNQTVKKAVTTVTVTATPNPSTYGQSVTITASVPAGDTGTITITSGGATLGSGTVGAAGTVVVTTSSLPVGSDTITASYSGDANNDAGTGSVVESVGKATATSTLTSSQNPSAPGASVTFTDTLPTGVTGTVTFTSGGTTLGTSTVTNGVASVSTSSLPGGSDTITATYSGDSNYNTSVATLTQTVTKITPTVTVSAAPNPSTFGGSVTITATVAAGATGTVTFTSGGVTLGSGTLNGSGVASFATTTLPVGSDTITASYGGDATYNAATGTTVETVSKVSPSMALNSSLNPAQANQPVTFTATLPTNVTGSVTFTSNGAPLGTSTITNGVATVTTSTLALGSDAIVATYGGDSNNGSATASLTETINKASPAVTMSSSPNPSTYGQTVTITASVPAGATGTITLTSGGTALGSGTVSTAGTVVVTTGSLPVGTDTITASYSGDTNDNPATGTTTQTVTKNTPTVTVSTSGPSNSGDPVTITVTLPPGTTGSVTLTSGGTTIGTGTVNPTTGTTSITTSTLPVGSDPITATYGGDSNNNPATGTTTQVVNRLTPTVTLTSSNNPSTVGQAVTFTATVPASATGTIMFLDGTTTIGSGTIVSGTASVTTSTLTGGTHTITASYGGDTNNGAATSSPLTQTVNKVTPVLPPPVVSAPTITAGGSETITETVPSGVSGPVTFSNGGTTIGTAPVVGGVATIVVTNLPVGSDPITASTPGDANNNPATSPATTVTVTKGTPTVGLTSSLNPSAANQAVTFTATLPTGVTGTVTFTDGATTLGTATVTNGVASVTVSTLTSGTHTITASYGGDSNYNAATSAPLTQIVNKATPVLPPPVVSAPTITVGGSETITETVPSGVSGPVTFTNGTTVIGTAPIVGGVATIVVTNLPVGSNPITASTPGDANNNPATSPATTVTVTQGAPTVTLTSSTNPANPGQSVIFTATVPAGATGTVTFLDGTTAIGTGTVNSSGIATMTTSTLATGTHTITASYSGDTSYSAAKSAPLNQVIGHVATTIMLTQSTPTELVGTAVTFTATVAAPVPTPTGTVSFMDGTTVLGTAPLSTNGSVSVGFDLSGNAAVTLNNLATGTHQITAVYSGDTIFSTSSSAPVTNIVQDFTNKNSGATTQKVFPGDSTSYTFTLAPVGSTTFMSDVNLTVTGLPAGSTYTFTPSKAAAGAGSTTVTLNVKTSSSLSARNHQPQGPWPAQRDVPVALGMLGLAGLGAARKYRRRMPRLLMMLLLLAGSLLPVAALSGCAGGYFALDPKPYTVTVTGTESTVQHAATATLMVE